MFINSPMQKKCSKCGSVDIIREVSVNQNKPPSLRCNNCGHKKSLVTGLENQQGQGLGSYWQGRADNYEEF